MTNRIILAFVFWQTTAATLVAQTSRDFIVIAEPGMTIDGATVSGFGYRDDDGAPGPVVTDQGVVAFGASVGRGYSIMTQRGVRLGPGDQLTGGQLVTRLDEEDLDFDMNDNETLFIAGDDNGAVAGNESFAPLDDNLGENLLYVQDSFARINNAGDVLYLVQLAAPDRELGLGSGLVRNNEFITVTTDEIEGRRIHWFEEAFLDGQGKVAYSVVFEDQRRNDFATTIIYDGQIVVSPGDSLRGKTVRRPRLHGLTEAGTLLMGDGSRLFTLDREVLDLPAAPRVLDFNENEQVLYMIGNDIYLDEEILTSDGDRIAGNPIQVFDHIAASVNNRGDVAFAASVGGIESVLVSTIRRIEGDVNGDGAVAVTDVDRLASVIRQDSVDFWFDVDQDGDVTHADHRTWVHDIVKTWFGDANLDGEFNSSDLVSVFRAGQYEDDIAMNSGWAQGDWNGDGDFTTSDFVLAFQDRGFEQGPRAATHVPEPDSPLMLISAMFGVAVSRFRATGCFLELPRRLRNGTS